MARRVRRAIEHHLRGQHDGADRHVGRLLHGRDPADPGAKGALQVDERRTWAFIHNGSADVTQCTGDLNEFNNNGVATARRARAGPVQPDIVHAGSYARGIWRSRTLALLDADCLR
jgi:hypothetical protein